MVDTDLAKKLSLSFKSTSEVSGAGESSLSRAVGSGVSFNIAGLNLVEAEVAVIPVNIALSAAEGRSVDGVLGYDFFEHLVVEIDYARRQITLYAPKAFHYTGPGTAIPFRSVRVTFSLQPRSSCRAESLCPGAS